MPARSPLFEPALGRDLHLHLEEVGRRCRGFRLRDERDRFHGARRHTESATDAAGRVDLHEVVALDDGFDLATLDAGRARGALLGVDTRLELSLIHISEPTRLGMNSY